MTKALIVYGTRYGATAGTSEEIARILQEEGFNVRVVNAKEDKVRDITEYELVVVGSGMQIDRWTGEAKDFLKKFQKELAKKKVALFVSSGAQAIIEHEGKPEEIGRARRKYLEEKAAKYNLQPVALGLFGGVWDYNKMPWWSRKAMVTYKQKIEAAGFKEIKPGFYDTRDWNAIRNWAKELAQKFHSLPDGNFQN
jgi:menaquinone-dependent protoporphyrinogen IX oxidase